MALDFDPRLDSSGSRSRRDTRRSSQPSAASGRRARARADAGGKPVKGKRKSVSASAQRQSAKASAKGNRKLGKEEKKLAKLERKNAKLASKQGAPARESVRTAPREDEGRDVRAEGTRVGDIRRREREERAQRARARYRRYVLRIVVIVLAVLVLIFGAIFLYRSDVFHVNNVHVTGVSHLTSQEITDIAAVPDDSTLLRIDSAGIISRLEDNAWVQSASIHREFPDTIRIDVVERTPGAAVRINDKSIWVISTDGTWLSAANDNDWDTQMRIIDVSTSLAAPISGGSCNDGGIVNALDILSKISDDLKGNIESISAESSIKTSLNLKNGITVAFGDSSDVELKEAVINELLQKYQGKISYINVRVPDRPTFRTLSE